MISRGWYKLLKFSSCRYRVCHDELINSQRTIASATPLLKHCRRKVVSGSDHYPSERLRPLRQDWRDYLAVCHNFMLGS